jgi:hypothetical protein
MNRSTANANRLAAVAAATAGVALILTGCGSSSGPSGGSSKTASTTGSGHHSSASSSPSAPAASSASVPFPIAVGDTWVYKTTALGISGTVTNKMISVTPVSGGQKVTMSTADSISSSANSRAVYIFHSDGSISYPFNQFSSSTSGASVTLVSGGVFWPPAAELATGNPYHSTLKIDYTISGQKQEVTSHVTVQGAGTATVTVPAGTYSATVVDMTLAEAIDGIHVSIEVRTWLASGVGPVQSEAILDEAGTTHVDSKQELTSFSKA